MIMLLPYGEISGGGVRRSLAQELDFIEDLELLSEVKDETFPLLNSRCSVPTLESVIS